MLRTFAIILVFCIAFEGFAHGQSFFDGIFGPGGLGIWGGSQYPQSVQSYMTNPDFYGGTWNASGQRSMPQGAGYGQPQAPGYGSPAGVPQGYSNYQSYNYQPGIYSDWQRYQQPAVQSQQPPVRYTAPPVRTSPRPQGIGSAPRAPGRLRPGQYSPRQRPPADEDDVPPGGMKITTVTPEGTTVRYYPPVGEPAPPGG